MQFKGILKSELLGFTVSEFNVAFSIWDENEDGTISCQHLGKVMRSLGQNPTSRDLKEMMQDVDIDGSNFHWNNLTFYTDNSFSY